jgi:hypothetical protein
MFYIIDKKMPQLAAIYSHGEQVGIFMLGRQVDKYIVVKSDERPDRVVNFTSYTNTGIELACEEA